MDLFILLEPVSLQVIPPPSEFIHSFVYSFIHSVLVFSVIQMLDLLDQYCCMDL